MTLKDVHSSKVWNLVAQSDGHTLPHNSLTNLSVLEPGDVTVGESHAGQCVGENNKPGSASKSEL